MQTIETISFSKLTNAEHVEFHNAVCTNINQHGAAALGLDATIVAQYKAAIGQEQDFVQRALGSGFTAQLAQFDHERDGLFEAVISLLESTEFYPSAAVKAEYPDVKVQILDRYPRSVKSEGAQTETSKIRGLLVDVAKLGEELRTTIGLATLTTALQSANDKFEQAYLARHSERHQLGSAQMANLRKACEDLYAQLCLAANYMANGPLGTDEDAADRQQAAQTFVAETNLHIAFYKRYYISNRKGTEGVEETEDIDETEVSGHSDDLDDSEGPENSATLPSDVVEVTEP